MKHQIFCYHFVKEEFEILYWSSKHFLIPQMSLSMFLLIQQGESETESTSSAVSFFSFEWNYGIKQNCCSFDVNLVCKSNKPLICRKRALTLTHTQSHTQAPHPKHLGATQKSVLQKILTSRNRWRPGNVWGQFAPPSLHHLSPLVWIKYTPAFLTLKG